MGTIEQFVDFARALPDAERLDIEHLLSDVMQSYAHQNLLDPEQIDEVKRRMSDPGRRVASQESVKTILGKSLPV